MDDNERERTSFFSEWWPVGLIALLWLGIHAAVIGRFGIFRDELYYLDCVRHLGFGYVDQPPLSIAILALVRVLFGSSLAAVRFLPILGGAAFILLSAALARELGGKRKAAVLSAACAFSVVGGHFMFHVYSMNFLEFLFWQVCILLIIRIVRTGNTRLWIAFGLAAGLGLQNKISVLFLLSGLGIGILLTRERRQLRSPYLWAGLVLAAGLFLPYVIWNATHGWAHLEFMRNAKAFKMAAVAPLEFLLGQVLYNNPATLLVWAVGLGYLFFHRKGRSYRLLGWAFLFIFVLFMVQEAKDYYLAGGYPVLFAAGAVFWESRTEKWGRGFLPVSIILILLFGLALMPLTAPVLSVEQTARMARALGVVESSGGERHDKGVMPQHFADMFGWEEMAAKVGEACRTLTAEERESCFVLTQNYGEAGAVNYFRQKYGLPPAYSGHNSHHFWPPEEFSGHTVIIIGGDPRNYEDIFGEMAVVTRTDSPYAMPYENDMPIIVCRRPQVTLAEIWPRLKHFN